MRDFRTYVLTLLLAVTAADAARGQEPEQYALPKLEQLEQKLQLADLRQLTIALVDPTRLQTLRLDTVAIFQTDGEPEVRDAMRQHVQESAQLLIDKFTLANAFADAATAMKIVEIEDARRITTAAAKVEQVLNWGSAAFAMVGTASLLFKGSDDLTRGMALGSGLFAALGNLRSGKGSDAQVGDINRAIAETAAVARRKAEALAIHSYVLIELESTKGALDRARADVVALQGMSVDSRERGLALARAYVAALKTVDALYDLHMLQMESMATNRAASPLFQGDSQTRLRTLANSIAAARTSWKDVRHFYARSERAATDYIAKYGNAGGGE